jgi:hypothetical protein
MVIHGTWQKDKIKYKLETTIWSNSVSICLHKNDGGSGSMKCVELPLKHFNTMVRDALDKMEGIKDV